MAGITDFIILFILIIVNGFFSMAEFALVSSRKTKLKQMEMEGKSGATSALTLIGDQTSFLSSIQIGITLVGVCTGAYGGAAFSHIVEPLFKQVPIIGNYSDFISLTIVIVIITYFSIVIGELVPKRIGLANPEKISCKVAPVFIFITWVFTPVSFLTSGLTNILVKILGISHVSSPEVIEEEIHMLLEEGTESGIIDETEQDMVESVFEFGDSLIVDLMVPRPDIIAIDINDPPEKNIEIMINSRHTLFPVYKETQDSIIGIVSVRDLWAQYVHDQKTDISGVMQEILIVPDQMTALDLIRRFKIASSPLAMVIDEYGSIIGLITLHDLLEALVGDLSRVDQENEQTLVFLREDGSWLVEGRTSPEELFELTGIDCTKESKEDFFRTMAGFILYQTGKIPKEGDIVNWNGSVFEIVDMDGNRIDKILITPGKEKI